MISNSDLHMLFLINFIDIMITEQYNYNFLNPIDYVLCIGYQYLNLGHILISPLVVNHDLSSMILLYLAMFLFTARLFLYGRILTLFI